QSEKTATASQWRGKKLPAGCIFYENFLSTLLSLSKSKIAASATAILLLQKYMIKCPHGQGNSSGGTPPV
ncbi:MAG: hypothetical protein LBQ30_02955, partial [Treponema sp.]|nr:hypothetical protein [Treponema sp.]